MTFRCLFTVPGTEKKIFGVYTNCLLTNCNVNLNHLCHHLCDSSCLVVGDVCSLLKPGFLKETAVKNQYKLITIAYLTRKLVIARI